MRRLSLLFISLLVPSFCPAQATWTPVTTGANDNLLEVALARTADGVLHVVWPSTGAKRSLWHRSISPEGKLLGEPNAIVENWSGLSMPKMLGPSGQSLRVLFSGMLGSPDRDNPYNKGALYAATSSDGGKSWQLMPGAQSASTRVYAGYLGAAGETVAYTVQGNVLSQAGLGATAMPVREGACCAYHTAVAVDSQSKETVVAWHQNTKTDPGIYARGAGEILLVPETQTKDASGSVASAGLGQQIALSGRLGAPGVYLAYCSGYPACQEIKVWPAQAGGTAATVAKPAKGRNVAMSPAPEGRLWVMWTEGTAAVAVRSNRALTRWSAPYQLGAAPGTPMHHLLGESSAGPLDAFAHVPTTGREHATFHLRQYPNLQITATPAGVLVTDLGDAVADVEVLVEGQTLRTDASGLAAHKLTPGKATPVQATHSAYAKATATLILPLPKKK